MITKRARPAHGPLSTSRASTHLVEARLALLPCAPWPGAKGASNRCYGAAACASALMTVPFSVPSPVTSSQPVPVDNEESWSKVLTL